MEPAGQRSLSVALILLTTGERTLELERVRHQAEQLDFDELIVVANGAELGDRSGWVTLRSRLNLGVPGGRNLGLRASTCDIAVFLDDDSSIPPNALDLVERVRQHFLRDLRLGALALRVVGVGSDKSLSRWDPTPRKRSCCNTICDVPTFPGNGHALRCSAIAETGGYLEHLFFKHEETELSWRLIDRGWRVRFDPSLVVEHPITSETRHGNALEVGLRNKIWIARLRLPWPLTLLAVPIAMTRSLRFVRSPSALKSTLQGARAGLGELPERRQPVSWKTVHHLSSLGRPPVL